MGKKFDKTPIIKMFLSLDSYIYHKKIRDVFKENIMVVLRIVFVIIQWCNNHCSRQEENQMIMTSVMGCHRDTINYTSLIKWELQNCTKNKEYLEWNTDYFSLIS